MSAETPQERAQRFFDETPEPEGTIDELIDQARRDAAAKFMPPTWTLAEAEEWEKASEAQAKLAPNDDSEWKP